MMHPNDKTPFNIHIAASDKDTIAEYKNNKDATKIFTDGSSNNGKVGASAVLYINDVQITTLRFHLGPATEHTVFEAELVGMILAAQLLTIHDIFPLPVSIFVDNQAAIIAGERPSSKPGHYLSVEFRKLLHELQEKHGLSSRDISVQWIAGHKDVLGNEEADREAKKAAVDKNSATPIALLPKILQKRLPISTLALKQKHKEDLNSRWKKTWSKSPRHNHLVRIDDSTPSKKYLKATGFMPKSRSGVLFQLRTGHIVLNKHLHRINKSDSPNCL